MSVTATLYKKLVPSKIRNIFLRKQILAYYHAHEELRADVEWTEVADWLGQNKLEIFPYAYASNYREEDIEVFLDNTCGMHYVLLDGKRLYFRRTWNAEKVRRNYNRLRIEQDPGSPHFYTSPFCDIHAGDSVADIGSAEGNFSLSIVDKVKQLYLFERDPGWLEALQKTFEPWKDKVEIIPKYMSDRSDEQHCRGDEFFAGKQLDFLKIDVDGGERPLLRGFEKTFGGQQPLRLAFCTYHLQGDEAEFTSYFRERGFATEASRRYMIFYHDKFIKAPYLRRGLIRAVR